MDGGIEAIYDDINPPTGMARFAPMRPARGAMFSSRRRLLKEQSPLQPVVSEADYYG
jgi:hypothetical protein